MKKYELVIFDMDGTLYRFEGSGTDGAIYKTKFYREIKQKGVNFIAERLSISRKDAERVKEDIYNKYNGEISIGLEKEYNVDRKEYFAKTWNVDTSRYINPDRELRILLNKILCKKALLTSAPQVWAERALNQLNIDDLFDGLWFGDGDIRKTDKKAYLQVTDSFDIKPERTLIVDDEPKHLNPAKEIGITTVLVGSEIKPYIDYYIKDIYGIQNLIGGK